LKPLLKKKIIDIEKEKRDRRKGKESLKDKGRG